MESLEKYLRVVTVSRDGLLTGDELARLADAGTRCEQLASPYEAAAALLAAPAAAVVVDMSLLNRKHLRMLELARKLGVTVLGTGAIPSGLTSDNLRGVRLVSRDELVGELRALSSGRYVSTATEEQDATEQEGTYEPQEQSPAYQHQSEKPVSLDEPREDHDEDAAADSGQSEEATDSRRQQRPQNAADVLSSDEISALLEEDF
ncbi:MAG: hypothetical protein ACLFVW_06555 [Phycisphaerae bacterium]